MTTSEFDPVMFGPYHHTKPPRMIHFVFDGSENVHRYVLVEVIPASDINPITRRKAGESLDEAEVRKQYIK